MLPLTILLSLRRIGDSVRFPDLTTALFTAGFTLLTAFLFHSNLAGRRESPDVHEKT